MRKQALILCAAICAAWSAPAQAQDNVASFYAGKTIRLVVGIDVGSGYDVNARLLARHLANHIPGKPTIVVQNQPGAGSAIMTSQLYTVGPFDGTAIGAAFAGMPTQPLLQPGSGIRFDPVKLLWLGNTNRETHVTYVWHSSPVQSLDEVKSKQLIMGAQAPGSSQVDFPLVANALFGTKFKVIAGYQSTAKINLALESGEVQGTIAAWTSVTTWSSPWLAVACRQEDQGNRAVGAAAERRAAGCDERARSRQDRARAGGAAAGDGTARHRPAVLRAAGRAGRARRRAAQGVRRDHEGQGLP